MGARKESLQIQLRQACLPIGYVEPSPTYSRYIHPTCPGCSSPGGIGGSETTITVIEDGSVGLSGEFIKAFAGEASTPTPLDELVRRYERGDFDLVAVGRALISDPQWVRKIHEGRTSELVGFSPEATATLV